jgi:hypothetical protein
MTVTRWDEWAKIKWRVYGKTESEYKVFVIRRKVEEDFLWQDKEEWKRCCYVTDHCGHING